MSLEEVSTAYIKEDSSIIRSSYFIKGSDTTFADE